MSYGYGLYFGKRKISNWPKSGPVEIGLTGLMASHAPLSDTPVTPNGDFTATFGDFKFGLVAGDRCVVAFIRRLAVTPKHRSQQIAAFLHN